MKNRHILLFLVVMIGVCIFLFTSFYNQAKQEAIKNINNEQLLHAQLAARGIEDFFSNWMRILTALAESPPIINMDKTGKENIEFLYRANQDRIRAITRVDAAGRITYTFPLNRDAIGRNISHQEHVREIMRTHKPVVSNVFFAVQGYDTVAIHVPVFRNRTYEGTIAVTINFQALAKRYLEDIKLGDTGYAWMTSRDGTELYCPVPGHTGKSVFENCKEFPSILVMAGEMLKGHQGVTNYTFDKIRGEELESIKKQAVYMPIIIGNTFWSIVVATSEDEIIASLQGFRKKLIAVTLFLLFVGIIFAYYGLKAWLIVGEEEQRRRTEDALRESERKLADIIEFLPDATFVIDLEGKVIAWNRAIEEMTGIGKGEMIGQGDHVYTVPFYGERRKHLLDLIDIDDKDLAAKYQNVKRKGSTLSAEAYASALYGGKGAHIFATGAPLFDAQGNRVGAIESIRDITERKRMEEDSRRLEDRLNRAEKMEALGTMAGGVAHDLNNVLGVVVGYAELLLNSVDRASPMKSRLENIMKGGERAAAIVQDLLTLARRGVPSRRVLNLNSIIDDVRNSPEFVSFLAQHPSMRLHFDLDPELLNIAGSSVHLGKTLYNLVANAGEAMPNGGILIIKTANQYLDKPIQGYDEVREGDYVVISVSDSGEGIPTADLKRIFEPFYTKKVMGRSGTGLGLAVVWGTVKDHNGYVNVQSEEGIGSVFTLYFPVTREEMSPEGLAVAISEYMGKGESILVVDDVQGQRDLATEMLRELNYNVTSVASGEEAVAYLQEHEADLMILDMIMDPGMDGLDTYRSVLAIRPQQKAIIVSGFSETDRVQAAQVLGAGAYVRKPYVIEKLGLVVRKELDRTA